MKSKILISVGILATALAGCGGGSADDGTVRYSMKSNETIEPSWTAGPIATSKSGTCLIKPNEQNCILPVVDTTPKQSGYNIFIPINLPNGKTLDYVYSPGHDSDCVFAPGAEVKPCLEVLLPGEPGNESFGNEALIKITVFRGIDGYQLLDAQYR